MEVALCLIHDYHPKKISYSGSAGASSTFAQDHLPIQAFRPQNGYPWASTSNSFPATVYFRFNSKQHVVKFAFRSREDGHTSAEQAPRDFAFVASDDCVNWVTLFSTSYAGFTTNNQRLVWSIPCPRRGYYYCYGIKTERPNNSNYISVVDVEMFE